MTLFANIDTYVCHLLYWLSWLWLLIGFKIQLQYWIIQAMNKATLLQSEGLIHHHLWIYVDSKRETRQTRYDNALGGWVCMCVCMYVCIYVRVLGKLQKVWPAWGRYSRSGVKKCGGGTTTQPERRPCLRSERGIDIFTYTGNTGECRIEREVAEKDWGELGWEMSTFRGWER